MSGNERGRITFAWLYQVAVDHANLPALAPVVAIKLTKFFNQKTGEAWMSQATLAKECRAHERTVRKNLDALISRGHLKVERARGWNKSNSYKMVLTHRADRAHENKTHRVERASESDNLTGSIEQSHRVDRVKLTGSSDPPNHLNDSWKNHPREGAHAPTDLFGEDASASEGKASSQPTSTTSTEASRQSLTPSRSVSRRSRRTPARPIPDDWVPDFDFATGLGLDAAIEAERFRDHALTNDRRCSSWHAAFRNWCRRGADMAKRANNGSGAIIDQHGNVINDTSPKRTRGRTFLEVAMEMNRLDQRGGDDQ